MRQYTKAMRYLVIGAALCGLAGGPLDLGAATRQVEREWSWRPLATGGFAEGSVYQVGALYLADFDGHLLATTLNFHSSGENAGIWRRADDSSWQRVDGGMFNGASLVGPLVEHGGYLYVAAVNRPLYRSGDGLSWTRVAPIGFADAASVITAMTSVGGTLLLGVSASSGAQVWASTDGDTWSQLAEGGFGDPDNTSVTDLASADGVLYAGTANHATGGELWASADAGASWQQIAPDGFGDAASFLVADIHVRPSGELFVGMRNLADASLWRRATTTADWELVTGDAFGTHGTVVTGLIELDGSLWATVATGASEGGQVWRLTPDGVWRAVAVGGTSGPTTDHFMVVIPHGDSLVFGTYNHDSGCEIWQMQPTESVR